jgi:hypothetical protein
METERTYFLFNIVQVPNLSYPSADNVNTMWKWELVPDRVEFRGNQAHCYRSTLNGRSFHLLTHD